MVREHKMEFTQKKRREFPGHGAYALSIAGRILRIDATGPGNKEMVEQYAMEVRDYRQQLAGKPWGSVVIFRGQALLTFDSEEAMAGAIAEAKQQGLIATAVILDRMDGEALFRAYWAKLYEHADIAYRFCENEQEALEWLSHALTSAEH